MHYNTCANNEPFEDLDYFDIEQYKYDGFLGCSNAPVYRFVDNQNNDIILALKELKMKDEEDYNRVLNNFRTLQKIKRNKHPNIIEIYGFCKVINKKIYGEDISAYLIMEHCEGNLDDYIQMKKKSNVAFTLTEIKRFFSQTLSALEFMQTNLSIAHRDIKPENILVHKTSFKIADLDDSKIDLNKTVEKSLVLGTLSFMAPELLKAYNKMKDRLSYNAYRSDVYSLGLCLLYMCTFRKFTRNERIDGVTNKSKYQEQIKQLRQNVKEKYGSVLSKLLKITLEMDPILRPDFKTLKKNAIDRAFLEKSDFYTIENPINNKRQQISIDLSSRNNKLFENNLAGRIKQHCILSDSDGQTTAHYSSDNQETSEGSNQRNHEQQQQQQYFQSLQSNNQFHLQYQNQQNQNQNQQQQQQQQQIIHYNNLQNINNNNNNNINSRNQILSRQDQMIQDQQRTKPHSSGHSSSSQSSQSQQSQSSQQNQVLQRNISGIDIHSRFSGGNFRNNHNSNNQMNNRNSGYTFSFDQPQRNMFESYNNSNNNNLNRLALKKESSDLTSNYYNNSNNNYFDNCQMSYSCGNNSRNQNGQLLNQQQYNSKCNSSMNQQLSSSHNSNSGQFLRNTQFSNNGYSRKYSENKVIPEAILEYNSMKNNDDKCISERTNSQLSNYYYQTHQTNSIDDNNNNKNNNNNNNNNINQINTNNINNNNNNIENNINNNNNHNNNVHDTVNQTMTVIDSRTNSQQSQYNHNETNTVKDNSFYPESQISDSKSERQNTFTVSEIIRENQNNKFQQQLNQCEHTNSNHNNNQYILSNQNQNNQFLDNPYLFLEDDHEYIDRGYQQQQQQQQQQYSENSNQNSNSTKDNKNNSNQQDNKNARQQYKNTQNNDRIYPSNLKEYYYEEPQINKKQQQNKQQIRNTQQQYNQKNKDLNLYEDTNQNTCISQKNNDDNKKKNNNYNNYNMVKIQEDENNFYETFLDSSIQTPNQHNNHGLNSLIENLHNQSNQSNKNKDKKRKYNQFQNPDQVRKLSKQRKTLTIVIGVMILFTIGLGLFYFIQQSNSSQSSSNSTDPSDDNKNPDDDHKTYTVEECKQLQKMYLSGKCYTKCPQQNYYPDIEQSICVQCDPSCLECVNGQANSCKKCKSDLFLLSLNSATGMCEPDCPNYYRKDMSLNKCIKCPENCISCELSSNSLKLNAPDDDIGSNGSNESGDEIDPDASSKKEATQNGDDKQQPFLGNQVICNHCQSEYYLFGDSLCLHVCPANTVTDVVNRKCVATIMQQSYYPQKVKKINNGNRVSAQL